MHYADAGDVLEEIKDLELWPEPSMNTDTTQVDEVEPPVVTVKKRPRKRRKLKKLTPEQKKILDRLKESIKQHKQRPIEPELVFEESGDEFETPESTMPVELPTEEPVFEESFPSDELDTLESTLPVELPTEEPEPVFEESFPSDELDTLENTLPIELPIKEPEIANSIHFDEPVLIEEPEMEFDELPAVEESVPPVPEIVPTIVYEPIIPTSDSPPGYVPATQSLEYYRQKLAAQNNINPFRPMERRLNLQQPFNMQSAPFKATPIEITQTPRLINVQRLNNDAAMQKFNKRKRF